MTTDLEARISGMSDEELLAMVQEKHEEYRKEALDLATSELTRRGITFTPPPEKVEESKNSLAVWAPIAALYILAVAFTFWWFWDSYFDTPLKKILGFALAGGLMGPVLMSRRLTGNGDS